MVYVLQEHDTSECGFAYSTADQVSYCPVQNPPTWPALLQLPEDQYTGSAPAEGNATSGRAAPGPQSVGSGDAPTQGNSMTQAAPAQGGTYAGNGPAQGSASAADSPTQESETGFNSSNAPLLYTGNDRRTADALMAALFARNQSLGQCDYVSSCPTDLAVLHMLCRHKWCDWCPCR